MKFEVNAADIKSVRDDVIVLGVFEKTVRLSGLLSDIDRAASGILKKAISSGDFSAKAGKTLFLYPEKGIEAKRILLLGLGREEKFTPDQLRAAAAAAARAVREISAQSFTFPVSLPGKKRFSSQQHLRAVVEGVLLGLYEFKQFKTQKDNDEQKINLCRLTVENRNELKKAKAELQRTQAVVQGVCLVRDLVSMPSNTATPAFLAQTAKKAARKDGLKCSVINAQKAKGLGMDAFLSVAMGSEAPPKLIVLEHCPLPRRTHPVFVLVGKAVTFDSGGISLKPPHKMEEMKGDMAGGAVVIAVLQVCARLNLPLNVVGIVPAAENLPSGRAFKPGDVLTSMSGKTIEIISTDAEGRLMLADALTYARRYSPSAVVDVATLTGGCVIALGNDAAAIMGNDDNLIEIMRKSGESTGERLWQLPLWEEYGELLKSDIADMKNSGGRAAASITGGYFLKNFVDNVPWAHIDIAGTAWAPKAKGYVPKGATGFGVRLLVEFLERWKA